MRERTTVAGAVSRWYSYHLVGAPGDPPITRDTETNTEERTHPQKNPATPIRFPVLTLVWALVAVTASAYVFIDHPDHRLRFFTNWSMIGHAIIAIVLLVVHLYGPRDSDHHYESGSTKAFWHVLMLFGETNAGPCLLALDWCISWVVLIGSRFIIADSTDWTVAQFKADPWIMAWGDFVYHILPPLMSIGLVWDHPRTSQNVDNFRTWTKALISLAPAVFMLSYRAAFDPKDVYMLHSRADALGLDALSALAVFFAALLFWFVPMKSNAIEKSP